MKETFKIDCLNFINLLKNRKPSKNITVYCEDVWYASAFSTVARALGVLKKRDGENYRQWHKENAEKMKSMILDLLSRLSPFGTISIYEEMQRIANACDVPYGIIQKIVGILIKYIVTNYYGGFNQAEIGKRYPWVKDEDFVKTLPIPIDSIVLWRLKDLGSGLAISQHGSCYAKINKTPWSRIDMDTYQKIQDEVKRMANAVGKFPLEFEMGDLWKK